MREFVEKTVMLKVFSESQCAMQREFQSAGLFYEMENMLGSFNKNLEVDRSEGQYHHKLLSRE